MRGKGLDPQETFRWITPLANHPLYKRWFLELCEYKQTHNKHLEPGSEESRQHSGLKVWYDGFVPPVAKCCGVVCDGHFMSERLFEELRVGQGPI